MDGWLVAVSFIGGFLLLVIGAELLVRGASSLALAAGISPLVVGLTVVAFATSAPELSVTLQSSLNNTPDLAVGNIVGSNITNLLLILGLVAIIAPFPIDQRLVRLDVPILIGVSTLFYVFGLNNGIEQWEGVVLFVLLIGYLILAIALSRREKRKVKKEYSETYTSTFKKRNAVNLFLNFFLCVIGVGVLILGSDWLVFASITTARFLGIDELIIGLTIIAVGTSLPEIATSIMAAIRGKRDIATGNVIGSNLFNLLCVGGITSLVTPGGLGISQQALQFDIPVLLSATLACLPIFYRGYRLDRWEGLLFVFYYIVYIFFIVLIALKHTALPQISQAILYFALPLTIVTVLILAWRWNRRPRV